MLSFGVCEPFPTPLFGMPRALCPCRGTPLWWPGFEAKRPIVSVGAGDACVAPTPLRVMDACQDIFTHTSLVLWGVCPGFLATPLGCHAERSEASGPRRQTSPIPIPDPDPIRLRSGQALRDAQDDKVITGPCHTRHRALPEKPLAHSFGATRARPSSRIERGLR